MTASAQPTPKTKPRKQPIAADAKTFMGASLAAAVYEGGGLPRSGGLAYLFFAAKIQTIYVAR
jgi:hypothetical protein